MSRSRRGKSSAVVAAAAVLAFSLVACSSGEEVSGQAGGATSGEITYWLWDNNQKPVYQQCADVFQEANPGLTVKISQFSWDDYWTGLTNAFVAGTAPDVFTDHLSRYPEFLSQNQIEPLDQYIDKKNVYQKGLLDLWTAPDGKSYGLPKDFDTVAIFYNKELVKSAGVAESDIGKLEWNPSDGGSYEKMIAHLTVDTNGRRGDEPGFDKNNVRVYGLGMDGGSGGANGQTQWSMYAGSTGWTFTDKNPWGTRFNYDQPGFQDTITWLRSLVEKGYSPPIEALVGQNSGDIFGSGKYAMIVNGSWMINQMFGYKGVEVGLAPTPIGPKGKRSSMYNGLADSIWAGSKNKAAAAKWVEFLGSSTCQDIVGRSGVVFPAIPSGTELANQAFKSRGIDVESSFLVHIKDDTTFLFPISDHASQISSIMLPAVDAVWGGQAKADSLTKANQQVNDLFPK